MRGLALGMSERRVPRLALLLVVVNIGFGSSRAFGWGAHGHRIATRVAEARLTPEARAAVKKLLHEGDTLVDIANWADHEGHDAVPGSAPWHYVNVPLDAPLYESRFCQKGACVVAKIKEFRSVLADPTALLRERQRALLFLVHLVEDVHQPLHVGDNQDRGGNLTQVQFLNQGTNLHRMWDTDLINAIDRNERDWVDRIGRQLKPGAIEVWSKGEVEDWANESLQIARQAYRYPEGASKPLVSGTTLGRDYEDFARPILERRLAQAGVRLANELNRIFGPGENR